MIVRTPTNDTVFRYLMEDERISRMMRRGVRIICILLTMSLLTGCLKDKVGGVRITADSDAVEVYSVTKQTALFLFHASGPWTATADASWLKVIKASGTGGTDTLKLVTTEKNLTGEERTAHVTVASDGDQRTVTIRQSGEYALFDTKELVMPAEGGLLEVEFRTNVADSLQLFVSGHLTNYLVDTRKEDSTQASRAEEKTGSLKWLRLLPNDSTAERSGFFFLSIHGKRGGRIDLDTLTFRQLTPQKLDEPEPEAEHESI